MILKIPLAGVADYTHAQNGPRGKSANPKDKWVQNKPQLLFGRAMSKKMRRAIDERGIAPETVLQPAQGMNKLSVRELPPSAFRSGSVAKRPWNRSRPLKFFDLKQRLGKISDLSRAEQM